MHPQSAFQTSHDVAAEAFFSKFGEYFLKAGLCGTCEKGDDADTPLTVMFAPLVAGVVKKVLAHTEALRTVPFEVFEFGRRIQSTLQSFLPTRQRPKHSSHSGLTCQAQEQGRQEAMMGR